MKRATVDLVIALVTMMLAIPASAIEYRKQILATLESKCASCHGEVAGPPAFAKIPLLRLVTQKYTSDKVRLARSRFTIVPEMSQLSAARRAEYRKSLARVVTERRMPPGLYLIAHPGSRLTSMESEQILAWTAQE